MPVKIITDSGTDLPNQLIDELGIHMMPLQVQIDNEEFLDGITIEPDELYDRMRQGAAPKTAQVSPLVMKETMLTYAKLKQQMIYITLSSRLSGTYQTALLMKEEVLEEYPEAEIEIFDSLAASLGFGLMVYKAAELALNGLDINEILQTLNGYRDHMEYIFTVDDLEYLFRGGRVSRTAAFMGTLLKIKPVLHMKDGKLFPLEKLRGKKKVLSRMVELMKERGTSFDHMTMAISHADDLESALALQEIIQSEYKNITFIVNMIGCAIGAHAGPGTLALFFLNEPISAPSHS